MEGEKLENFDPTADHSMRKEKDLGTQAYRDNLAKELRGVEDYKERKEISDQLKEDPKYQEARKEKMSSGVKITNISYENIGDFHNYSADVNGKEIKLQIGPGDKIEKFTVEGKDVHKSDKATTLALKIVKQANFVDTSSVDFEKAKEITESNDWVEELDL